MIGILQFGEGNFLRAFVDTYFDTLNKEGLGPYEVTIVKPIPYGTLDLFCKQNNKYHTILRGQEAHGAVESVQAIDVIKRVIDPFAERESFFALAADENLALVISNTTEAGIVYQESDTKDDFEGMSYPAKLTLFLYERYLKGFGGLTILPCELIDNNATALRECVRKYIRKFELGDDFYRYNEENNTYLNTLVDRIVSGYPRDEEVRAHLTELIGEEDRLMTVGEPFGLWAVERGGNVESLLKEGKHNIDVVITDDIGYYKKRKVRVLNGAHTGMVPMALWMGKTFVYDSMKDERIFAHLSRMLAEITPYVSEKTEDTEVFARDVLIRFENPYLNHALTAILLNSISKWIARNMPSYLDYYEKNKALPEALTIGFSYLIALYSRAKMREDGTFYAVTPHGEVPLQDTKEYLLHFANGGTVHDFLTGGIFPESLISISEFLTEVEMQVSRILNGEELV